jgi:uncharacterized protein (TIGR03067 family)
MRSTFGMLLMGVVLALSVGCGKKDPTGSGSNSAVATPEGAYVITGMEMKGEKMPAELFSKSDESERTIKFSGDKLTSTKRKKEETITVKYDTTKSPPHITTIESKPDGKTETMYGIYKIEGDTLTICARDNGNGETDRPKEFKTSKDSEAMIMTLTRKK